ncbi:hypothetical protein [Ferrimicrobium acidiphilum]|uniref:Uncharacterized protein n=1 Tax=Ferrimicrobium acidiphilum DSM 19497 TaxID=1121877 RepID=A0A0D8FU19_9ACTN|nr:hypothetical protein [Ferrimicrobium acidiphilum]KJE76765.1 hypothetical protein FEAC_14110 [Ferrimicrobium acidiphilum DSM 19497]
MANEGSEVYGYSNFCVQSLSPGWAQLTELIETDGSQALASSQVRRALSRWEWNRVRQESEFLVIPTGVSRRKAAKQHRNSESPNRNKPAPRFLTAGPNQSPAGAQRLT